MPTNSMTHDKQSGRFHFAQTVADGATGDPLLLPSVYPHDPGYKPVAVYLKPAGGGSARIEFTLSTPAEVEAATAVWAAWPDGDVSSAVSRSLVAPVTAMRCVSVSGAADWGLLK